LGGLFVPQTGAQEIAHEHRKYLKPAGTPNKKTEWFWFWRPVGFLYFLLQCSFPGPGLPSGRSSQTKAARARAKGKVSDEELQEFHALCEQFPEVIRGVARQIDPALEGLLDKMEGICGGLRSRLLVEHLLCEYRKLMLGKGRPDHQSKTPDEEYAAMFFQALPLYRKWVSRTESE